MFRLLKGSYASTVYSLLVLHKVHHVLLDFQEYMSVLGILVERISEEGQQVGATEIRVLFARVL